MSIFSPVIGRKEEKMNTNNTIGTRIKECRKAMGLSQEALAELLYMKKNTTMCSVFILLVIISAYKDLSPAPLSSMICAYNGATFLGKAKDGKDKTDLITGIIFFMATALNTVVFIVK